MLLQVCFDRLGSVQGLSQERMDTHEEEFIPVHIQDMSGAIDPVQLQSAGTTRSPLALLAVC